MIPHSRLHPHLLTTALGLFSATTLPAATLRVLPVTNSESFAYGLGLSSGGSVAGFVADLEASLVPTLWSKTSAGYGAPLSLPLLPGGAGGEVRWISANGALAAGYVDLPTSDFSLNLAPVLWSRDTAGNYGVTGLPRLAGSPAAGIVAASSSTGARLAGVDGDSEAATVWRGSPGASYVAQALPLPSGAGHPSFATAASSDGAWLAGRVTTTTTAAQQAVVWSEANGIYSARALQVPAGSTETLAEAISADGTLIAGTSDNAGIYVATKWDARTGQATRLESRADADTAALAVASDKLWIGGRATDILDYTDEAMLWDAQGKAATLASLAPDINFGSFVPGEIRAITLVSPGVYTLVGTGATLGTGQTQAFVIENLSFQTSGSGVTTPTTTTPDTGTPTTSTPGTTTPTTGTPTTSTPTTGTSGTGSTGTDSTSLTPGFDPASSTSRTLVGDTFSAIFDPTRATQWRFAGDQAALRPLRVTFPGTSRDALSFDGTRMLPGPLAQDLFSPGVAQDMAFVGAIRIPATGGSGKAILFAINHSAAEPAIALGYDYSQSRFYAVYLQAFNGAPSEIAGPASPRDASYVVRLQKTGGALGLYVNGTLVAQTNSARPAILNAGQGAPLGLGGIRPLNPQFVGQLGKFHLRNTALSVAEAASLETDLRGSWLSGGATATPPTTSTPTTTTPTTTTPTTTTPTSTTTAAGISAIAGVFDPAASGASTLVNNAYSALYDPARATWRFATDQAAIRPLRVAFPGTTRDSLSFDGTRMLPGPRSSDLFAPGVAQDLGIVAAVRIPATGGSGRATLLTVNLSDTEPAVGIGYDYSSGQFFAHYTQAFNGAPSLLSGGAAPRGATYVVRLQKVGGALRLFVNGGLVAQTASARPVILASGQNGYLGLGGVRALNPQFVGQVGKFYLRNSALGDTDAATLEADARAWFTP